MEFAKPLLFSHADYLHACSLETFQFWKPEILPTYKGLFWVDPILILSKLHVNRLKFKKTNKKKKHGMFPRCSNSVVHSSHGCRVLFKPTVGKHLTCSCYRCYVTCKTSFHWVDFLTVINLLYHIYGFSTSWLSKYLKCQTHKVKSWDTV